MKPRIATGVVGVVTVLLGLAGLTQPLRVLAFTGFMVENASRSAGAFGEVRATYGGVFLVLGVYTLLATVNPVAHRSRLVLLGLVWVGACAGRLFGVSVDGSPGLFGWLSAGFELVMGGTLLLAALGASAAVEPMPVAVGAETEPAVGVGPPA